MLGGDEQCDYLYIICGYLHVVAIENLRLCLLPPRGGRGAGSRLALPSLNHENPDGGMEDRLSPTDFFLGLFKCK